MQESERLTGAATGQRYTAGSAGVTVASQLASWRSRRGVGLDITALPDMQVLSAKVGRSCGGFALADVELLFGRYILCFKPVRCTNVCLEASSQGSSSCNAGVV